jgi:prepilin-type N-terminal cleavage/methylation domain-containing protein
MIMKKNNLKNRGFTLAELLMAMWVISIILAAVAVLSFALGSANDSADNSSEIYSRIRYTTMYLGELVRNSKLICANWGSSVAIWQADDNGNSQIDPNEKVDIEYDSSNNCLKLIRFTPSGAIASSTILMNNCSDVTFTTDQPPPRTKRLNIFFTINQQKYQITAQLRCYAGYLLNDANEIDPNDDDI